MQTVNPKEVGVDPQRLERLFSVIERKADEGWLYGGAFLLARRGKIVACLLYTSPSPRDRQKSRMPSSA